MAYNALTGTVVANSAVIFKKSVNGNGMNAIEGEFHGDGLHLYNVARVVANGVNDYVTTIGSNEQDLVGEQNLRFNGSRLLVNGSVTASYLNLTSLSSYASNPDNTTLLAIDSDGNIFKSNTTPAGGPLYSIQFEGDNNSTTGSSDFIFNPSSNSLYVSGAMTASLMQLTNLPQIQNPDSTTLIAIDVSGNLFKSVPAPSVGPLYSIQFEGDNNGLSGSSNLTFDPNNNQVALSGNLVVSGNITAHTFDIVHTDITEIDASGSTNFGNSNDDNHIRTGSFVVVSSSTEQFKVDTLNRTTAINTGLVFNAISVTSDYTITKNNYIIGVDTNGGAVTVTLPDATTLAKGHSFVVKDEGGVAYQNNITISAPGVQKINNSNTAVLQVPYSSIMLYCDGSSRFFTF